jgi:nitrite reductase (NADH) small subunit
VCRFDELTRDRGVCALVAGEPVAVFRCSPADELFAIGNVDPFCGASVLSRGLVGALEVDGATVPYVASPMRKHRFELQSGRCLDDPTVTVGSFAVRQTNGVVEVAPADSRGRNDLETVA